MRDVYDVAKYFIKNDADSFPNTYEGNMKLQSLLVFANMINVAKNGHVQNVIQIITEMLIHPSIYWCKAF